MSIVAGGIEAAKDYARRGWQVVILHGHCDGVCTCRARGKCSSPGKHPRQKAWQQHATSDEQTLERLFRKWPGSNLGIRLGPSSGLVDIEYDDSEGETTAQELLSDIQTPTYTSHRSRHRLFSFPQFTPPKAVAKARGLELRFGTDERGAQSVFPPSVHASGVAYRWADGLSPADVSLAEFPEALLKLIESPIDSNGHQGELVMGDDDTLATHPGASQGNRNDELCRLIGRHIKSCGVSSDLVPKALAWGSRCSPPMAESEVLERVAYIAGKEQAKGIQAGGGVVSQEPTLKPELIVRRGDEILPEQVEWLWAGRIPIGKLSLLVGQGEAGKTFVSCEIIARLSRGEGFPESEGHPAHGVSLIATAEDGLGDTIRPRLDDLGAEHSRWYSLDMVKMGDQDVALQLDRHVHILDAFLVAHPEVKLLVIDPLTAYLGNVNSHNDAEVRTVLSPLCKLAERRRCAVLGIMHLNKSQEQKVQQRVSGSIAFINAARCAWLVTKDEDDADESRRLFLRVKGNLKGMAKTGLAFSIENDRVVWEPDPIFVSAGDLDDGKPDRSKVDVAMAFLSEFLAGGRRLAGEVAREANRRVISKRSLERAKAELGVVSEHPVVPGPWYWRLEEPEPEAEQTQVMVF